MNVNELAARAQSSLDQTQGALKEFKAHHLNLLATEGLGAQGEGYKFTNIKRFFEELSLDASPTAQVPLPEKDALVFIDGKLVMSPKIEGLKITPLSEVELRKTLVTNAPLSHLHHGLMHEGHLLEVEKNVELKNPVLVIHVIGKQEVQAPTLVIKMGPFSKMTLLEEARSSRQSYAQISESYVELATGSKLEHVQLDSGNAASLLHGSTWAQVGQDASYTNFIFHLNGKLQRRNLDIKLLAPGSDGQSYALFLTSGEEHSDISTVINHMSPDTTSNQISKGILGGDSKGVFTGKIHIHPKAQRVASGQINRNLLLSKKAQVHSQPQLEIFADDVKCSHGSTTGQLSPDEVFYFETRGIPEEKARTLLAFGFGLEVVLKLQNEKVRETVKAAVQETLKNKFNLGGVK